MTGFRVIVEQIYDRFVEICRESIRRKSVTRVT